MALHSCGSCEVVDDDDSAKEEQWSPAWEDTFTGWDDMFGGGSKCDSTSDSDSEASAFCHAQGIGDGFGEVFPGWLRRRWEKERKGHELEDITRDARKTQQFSPEQDELSPELEAELEAMQQQAEQKGDLQRRQKTEELVRQVRDLGRWPKESAARSLAERQLAEKFRRARKANQFSPDEEAELEAVQQAEREASAAACLTGASSNQAPPGTDREGIR